MLLRVVCCRPMYSGEAACVRLRAVDSMFLWCLDFPALKRLTLLIVSRPKGTLLRTSTLKRHVMCPVVDYLNHEAWTAWVFTPRRTAWHDCAGKAHLPGQVVGNHDAFAVEVGELVGSPIYNIPIDLPTVQQLCPLVDLMDETAEILHSWKIQVYPFWMSLRPEGRQPFCRRL